MSSIKSLLDNDLYKFTMQAAVFKLYPDAIVKYKFINRGKTTFSKNFAAQVQDQVIRLSNLRFNKDEIDFLRNQCPYLSPLYLEWLKNFRFDPSEVVVNSVGENNFSLCISGPWCHAILWEVPLMASISELYFQDPKYENVNNNLRENNTLDEKKAKRLKNLSVSFADFGTRRRFSQRNHDRVVGIMKKYGSNSFIGSSNVLLARKHRLKVIGTNAHEWYMFHAAKYGFRYANELSLKNWVDVFQGELSIALSDTYTSDSFFKSFNKKYAKLLDGVRHDSGDPINFAKKAIAHYQNLDIDPRNKIIVFSDNLNTGKVEEIARFCEGKIRHFYGIGTNFTNDVGVTPLNVVIKLIGADPNGSGKMIPTVKLSDVKGKHTGDPEMIKLCKSVIT